MFPDTRVGSSANAEVRVPAVRVCSVRVDDVRTRGVRSRGLDHSPACRAILEALLPPLTLVLLGVKFNHAEATLA